MADLYDCNQRNELMGYHLHIWGVYQEDRNHDESCSSVKESDRVDPNFEIFFALYSLSQISCAYGLQILFFMKKLGVLVELEGQYEWNSHDTEEKHTCLDN